MSEKLLSEEELDTLLDNVPEETGLDNAESDGECRLFNFEDQHNQLVAKMSRLSSVRDNFINELSGSLFDIYEREPHVSVAYEHVGKFGQYIDSLDAPSNINLIYVLPERKPALVVLDPALLYILVDQYFGGAGTLKGKRQAKVLSPTEWRTAQQMVELVCKDLKKAWHTIADFSFSHAETQENPENARIYGSNEIVHQTVFRVGFEDAIGEMHVILPYALLESIKHSLEADAQPEAEESAGDEPWQKALAEQVRFANVTISGSISGNRLSVEDLVNLKPGDVIPINMPEHVSVRVERVPTFKGTFGIVNRKHAIQINETYFNGRK